jgi:hypothetical protein
MQLHDYPEHEWQTYLNLVENDMELLAYCQELDPVASKLFDTLSQYLIRPPRHRKQISKVKMLWT